MEDEMKKVQQTLTDLEGLKNDTAAYVRELDLSLEQLGAELSSLEEQRISKKRKRLQRHSRSWRKPGRLRRTNMRQ